jgi:hypothetical protein
LGADEIVGKKRRSKKPPVEMFSKVSCGMPCRLFAQTRHAVSTDTQIGVCQSMSCPSSLHRGLEETGRESQRTHRDHGVVCNNDCAPLDFAQDMYALLSDLAISSRFSPAMDKLVASVQDCTTIQKSTVA